MVVMARRAGRLGHRTGPGMVAPCSGRSQSDLRKFRPRRSLRCGGSISPGLGLGRASASCRLLHGGPAGRQGTEAGSGLEDFPRCSRRLGWRAGGLASWPPRGAVVGARFRRRGEWKRRLLLAGNGGAFAVAGSDGPGDISPDSFRADGKAAGGIAPRPVK